MSKEVRTAPCPRCGGRAALDPANRWRPFCSERCRMIDLGKWAAGEYSIPAEDQSGRDEIEEPPRKPN